MAVAYEPPVSDDRGPLVIRPSWKSLGRWELHLLPLVVIVTGFGLAKAYARHSSLEVIVLMGIILGLTAVVYALFLTAYMIGTSITVTNDAILVRHWFFERTIVPVRDIARVVRCQVSAPKELTKPAVFVLSSSGRCVMSLYTTWWNPADLDRIWHHLGIDAEGTWRDELAISDLATRFPGAF